MSEHDKLIEQQKVLADFGEFALRSDDLGDVLHEACSLVARALGTDLAKILEIEEGGNCLLMKAGVGWKSGVVGNVRLPMGERSSESYSIEAGKPVITRNVAEETRFDLAEVLTDHGAVALVNTPIFLPGGKAYGLLQVDSREPRNFDEEDITFLRTYTSILGPVIDRLHKLHSLEQALETNRRLMDELQHRVKNHLAIVTGLVRARLRQVESEEARAELQAVGERIETLRLVNEQLYIAGMVDALLLRPFASRLVDNLCDLRREETGNVTREIEIDEEVEVAPGVAVCLGLILNEFVTNSLKYAFDERPGKIVLQVTPIGGTRLRLCVSDDGGGLPSDRQAAQPGSGTGMRLIEGLAQQIGAEPDWSSSSTGTVLRLDFYPSSQPLP